MYMKKSAGETWLSAVTQECHAWAARLSCMARASLCLSVVSSVSCNYQQFCLAEMMSQVLSFGALITGRNQRVFFLSYSQCNRAVWCCCRDVEVNFLTLPGTHFLIIWHLKEVRFLNTQEFLHIHEVHLLASSDSAREQAEREVGSFPVQQPLGQAWDSCSGCVLNAGRAHSSRSPHCPACNKQSPFVYSRRAFRPHCAGAGLVHGSSWLLACHGLWGLC